MSYALSPHRSNFSPNIVKRPKSPRARKRERRDRRGRKVDAERHRGDFEDTSENKRLKIAGCRIRVCCNNFGKCVYRHSVFLSVFSRFERVVDAEFDPDFEGVDTVDNLWISLSGKGSNGSRLSIRSYVRNKCSIRGNVFIVGAFDGVIRRDLPAFARQFNDACDE